MRREGLPSRRSLCRSLGGGRAWLSRMRLWAQHEAGFPCAFYPPLAALFTAPLLFLVCLRGVLLSMTLLVSQTD